MGTAMKYIRTSDKIIENKMNMNFADRKQADTIEELCDKFVSVDKEDGHHGIYINGKPYYSKYCDIYGAIWTKKGLIYVAKLNEKGELELL